MKNQTYHVAIVGATGLVGQAFLKVLNEQDFPIGKLTLYASKQSKGKEILFQEQLYYVKELSIETIDPTIDIALFSSGGTVSKEFAPLFVANNSLVIDNSSAWRNDPNVPLIVPEVNGHTLTKANLLIANPNCSTIASMATLKLINELFVIKNVIYHTYQATSGSGFKGLNDFLEPKNHNQPQFYPKPIHNNVIPHIDVFFEDGYTKEEVKMIDETKKILDLNDINVFATCVRVPVDYGHSIASYVECEKSINLVTLESALRNEPSIRYYEKPSYPTPRDVKNTNDVLIGRLRIDRNHPSHVSFWAVLDNVRKGAASNAVQIAQYIIKEGFR